MKLLAFLLLFGFAQAEQYHPIDNMEENECWAEYGTNCEEAEEQEQEEYEQEYNNEEGNEDDS
jgi:hypothetical protein